MPMIKRCLWQMSALQTLPHGRIPAEASVKNSGGHTPAAQQDYPLPALTSSLYKYISSTRSCRNKVTHGRTDPKISTLRDSASADSRESARSRLCRSGEAFSSSVTLIRVDLILSDMVWSLSSEECVAFEGKECCHCAVQPRCRSATA